MARILETLPGRRGTRSSRPSGSPRRWGTVGRRRWQRRSSAQRLEQKIARNAPVDTGELKGQSRRASSSVAPIPASRSRPSSMAPTRSTGRRCYRPTHFMSEIVKGGRAAWEADLKATKATLDKKVAAAEKKERGR